MKSNNSTNHLTLGSATTPANILYLFVPLDRKRIPKSHAIKKATGKLIFDYADIHLDIETAYEPI